MTIKNLTCKRWPNKKAKNFIKKYHYTKSSGIPIISYALYNGTKIEGCIIFGRSACYNLTQSIWEGGNDQNTLEFVRMFCFDHCPKNTESYFIGQAINCLKYDLPEVQVLVSYSDISAGHVGYIYQATNWFYIGDGASEKKIFLDGKRVHRRSLYSVYGTSSMVKLKELLGDRILETDEKDIKYKYIFIIKHNKKQWKSVYKKLKIKPLPYPKGKLQFYSAKNNIFSQIDGKQQITKEELLKDEIFK